MLEQNKLKCQKSFQSVNNLKLKVHVLKLSKQDYLDEKASLPNTNGTFHVTFIWSFDIKVLSTAEMKMSNFLGSIKW